MDVKINWNEPQYKEVVKAMQIVSWLKEEGLENNIDFTWIFEPPSKTTKFTFFNDKEKYGTLLALKFQ